MGKRSCAAIAAIEAAYREDLDTDAWLAGVIEAARPDLDEGIGIASWTFDADALARATPRFGPSIGMNDARWQALGRLHAALPPSEFMRAVEPSGCMSLSQRMRGSESWQRIAAMIERDDGYAGIKDAYSLVWMDPVRKSGVAISSMRRQVGPPPGHLARRWTRVGSHLGAAFRLRSPSTPATEEAVLRPDGRVDHAEGEALPAAARAALRDAAVEMDRARGPLGRSDPDDAIETWRALVAGRWSLVDRFDSDGRRYVVAHANPIGAPTPTALSARQRDVVRMRASARSLKVIAYELGLAVSTVSSDLQRAVDKLGLRSIAEVIALANALGAAGDAGASDRFLCSADRPSASQK